MAQSAPVLPTKCYHLHAIRNMIPWNFPLSVSFQTSNGSLELQTCRPLGREPKLPFDPSPCPLCFCCCCRLVLRLLHIPGHLVLIVLVPALVVLLHGIPHLLPLSLLGSCFSCCCLSPLLLCSCFAGTVGCTRTQMVLLVTPKEKISSAQFSSIKVSSTTHATKSSDKDLARNGTVMQQRTL